MADWRSMQKARRGQLERHPSTSGVPPSRGGASTASEHGVLACHLCGQSERETRGLPFTDWLGRTTDHTFIIRINGVIGKIHSELVTSLH
jgi:hypothetical protein